jgi:hypothetical protein
MDRACNAFSSLPTTYIFSSLPTTISNKKITEGVYHNRCIVNISNHFIWKEK